MVKIATWNICLGLKSKKNYIKSKISEEQIDICCIQECEILKDYPTDILSFTGYNLEVENNSVKSRCCTYVRSGIPYVRRSDLEGMDNNLVIIDVVLGKKKFVIINLYRSFAEQHNVSTTVRFATQLDIISQTISNNPTHTPVVLGDFNLDFMQIHNPQYRLKNNLEALNKIMSESNMLQIVDYRTWSRNINGILKESTLDHIYVNDVTIVQNLYPITPEIGDHKLIVVEINGFPQVPTPYIKRNWKNYNINDLRIRLMQCNFDYGIENVQQYWNRFENDIISVVDEIAPLTEFTNNYTTKTAPNNVIKPLVNKKRRLLRSYKQSKNPAKLEEIKAINTEIIIKLKNVKKTSIRRCIIPGNSKSLWNAVKMAKDINPNEIPKIIRKAGVEINPGNVSESFAEFFDKKVKSIVSSCTIDENVYNGRRIIPNSNNKNFVNYDNCMEALRSIKIKNCEGYDRIPQRILNEGKEILINPITKLFNLIYEYKTIPEQWSISKIIPIFKKGSKTDIENYRPIANLCSTTKVFEQLIINRIREIEKDCNIDITNNSQHGFKKNRSTATAGLTIQSVLSHALDNNEYSMMASIDLSAAFDVVNIGLLLKRLKILGLPNDVIELIKIWLSNRLFYVDINGETSFLKSTDTGTIQGSRLGPILYAIYVSPLFDIEKMTNYADDNFIIKSHVSLEQLIIDMKKSLEAITKWLKKSGLKVNDEKTEICLFHRQFQGSVTVEVNGINIKSKPNMNVLGVLFDSKLNWNDQVANIVKKTNSALHCIRQIKFYFSPPELIQIITSNVYSIMYYNSEIWNIPTLHYGQKQLLLSSSANALKICTPQYHDRMSYRELHSINNRATPDQMCLYKHSLLLYKLINLELPHLDWIDINFQQNFNNRSSYMNFFKTNRYKIGENIISNRLHIINAKIEYDWIMWSFDSFKLKCKKLFLNAAQGV